MSQGINKVLLIGNVGVDPEYKSFANGGVLKLRVATSERFKNKAGDYEERTEWHSISVFGRSGEALARFVTKGMQVYVEGRLRTSTYEKDGEKRYRTEIVADNVQVLTRKGQNGSQTQALRGGSDFHLDSEDDDVVAAMGGTPF